jgi:hypothetical protein
MHKACPVHSHDGRISHFHGVLSSSKDNRIDVLFLRISHHRLEVAFLGIVGKTGRGVWMILRSLG